MKPTEIAAGNFDISDIYPWFPQIYLFHLKSSGNITLSNELVSAI
jgi:hypothetical protein